MITHTFARRRLLAAGLVVSVAVGLAGCTGGGDAAQPADARTLTLAVGAQPPSFDPAQADQGESTYIWTGIYDTLLTVDPDGAIKPRAAKSWEYSADARTLTLTLRDDLKFSSGEPVTAEDVAGTIDRSRTTPGPRVSELQSIESVAVAGEHTVVLNLSAPDPSILTRLAMAGGIVGDVESLNDPDTALNPVGSGPYVLDKNASTTGSTYVLTRRDDYWDVESYPYSKVTIRVIEDPQAKFNALQAGEIDAGTARANEVQSLEGTGLAKKTIEATAWGGIVIMDRAGKIVPALGDVRVRKAINMAFDRDLYAKQLLNGGGRGTNQFYNPAQPGYDADLDGFYKHDVEGAKKLLAEAGYPDGFALTMPSSFFSVSAEPAITQSLSDIGITVKWEAVPPQEVSSSLSSGKYGAAWFVEGLGDPSVMTNSDLGPKGQLNPTGWTTPELTALLDKVKATTDPEKQAAAYEEINRYSVENALVAPVMYMSTYWMTRPGVEFRPNGAVPLYLSNFGAN